MIRFNRLISMPFVFAVSLLLSLFILFCSDAPEYELTLGPRSEWTHPGNAHETHISPPSVAVGKDGGIFIAWIAEEGETNNLYAFRSGSEAEPVRVNPDGMSVDSAHQSPGIAAGPGGEIYVSWSSSKPKPEGVLFASDLNLSVSLDGGKSFDNHLRINEDRPISHTFDGLDVASDGTVYISWIDERDGWEKAGTYLARVVERGTQVESRVELDGDACVCCRTDLATGIGGKIAVLWRKVFPENVRDMVLAIGSNGSFAAPKLVHDDGWQINACPHRGGSVAIDDKGRVYTAWYTEGDEEYPTIKFAVSDGTDFSKPLQLDDSTTSIPDHVQMAINKSGHAVVVWEDSTAVRRRILVRYTTDGGKTFSPVHTLSQAIKAYSPDIAATPQGNFVVVWHEEEFPATKTVVRTISFEGKGK